MLISKRLQLVFLLIVLAGSAFILLPVNVFSNTDLTVKTTHSGQELTLDDAFTLNVQFIWHGDPNDYRFLIPSLKLDNLILTKIGQSIESKGPQIIKSFNFTFKPIKNGVATVRAFQFSYQAKEAAEITSITINEQPLTIFSSSAAKWLKTYWPISLTGALICVILPIILLKTSTQRRRAVRAVPVTSLEQTQLVKLEHLEMQVKARHCEMKEIEELSSIINDYCVLKWHARSMNEFKSTKLTALEENEQKKIGIILDQLEKLNYAGNHIDQEVFMDTVRLSRQFIHQHEPVAAVISA